MLDQLKELLEMQRVLDQSIFDAKGIKEYPLENMKIALFVELGELMNEFPTKFKHWKKTAVDNREKGLEEYVDVLHFMLSICNFYETIGYEPRPKKYDSCKDEIFSLDRFLYRIVEDLDHFPKLLVGDVFILGNYLGFTWEEIYSAYKKKNEINYIRLKSGY